MAGKPKFSNADIIKALEEKKGMIYLAAKLIGCHPDTIFKRARRNRAIQTTIDAARGVMIDNAETKLDEAINKGESWAVAFALRTIGRNRGYVERQEVSGADGGPLETKDVTYSEQQRASLITALVERARNRDTGSDTGE